MLLQGWPRQPLQATLPPLRFQASATAGQLYTATFAIAITPGLSPLADASHYAIIVIAPLRQPPCRATAIIATPVLRHFRH
jgi:hypothetical protein